MELKIIKTTKKKLPAKDKELTKEAFGLLDEKTRAAHNLKTDKDLYLLARDRRKENLGSITYATAIKSVVQEIDAVAWGKLVGYQSNGNEEIKMAETIPVKTIVEIKKLPEKAKTSIKGYVVAVTPPKTFNKKDGTLTNSRVRVKMIDDTGEMDLVLWGRDYEFTDRLAKSLREGRIIVAENLQLKKNTRSNSLELHYNDDSTVLFDSVEVRDTRAEFRITMFDSMTLDSKIDKMLDFKAEVTGVYEKTRKQGDGGREIVRQSIRITDEQENHVYVTIWGDDIDMSGIVSGSVVYGSNFKGQFYNDKVNFNTKGLSYFEILSAPSTVSIAQVKAGESPEFFTTKGTITEISEIRVFNRNDGTESKVRSMGFQDGEEQIRLVLWGNIVDDFACETGDAIVVTNVRVKIKEDDGSKEIHSTSGTTFRNVNEPIPEPQPKTEPKKKDPPKVAVKKPVTKDTKGIDFAALNEARGMQFGVLNAFQNMMQDTLVPSISKEEFVKQYNKAQKELDLEEIDSKVLNYALDMLIQKGKIVEDGDHIKWA